MGGSYTLREDRSAEAPGHVTLGPRDPRTKYRFNIFCRILFCWLDPLFFSGCRKDLTQSDLYACPSEAGSEKLLNQFLKHWQKELKRKSNGQKPRLYVAIFKCFWLRLVVTAILMSIWTIISTCQAFLVGYLSDYFTLENVTAERTALAYASAFGIFACAIAILLILGHGVFLGYKLGMMVRIVTTAAIYRKVLKLKQVSLNSLSIGHVINLASNDVQRFDLGFLFIHYLWIGPIHLAVITAILYFEVGPSVFIAILYVLILLPFQMGLGKLYALLRLKSALLTDKRVKVMNEVISGMRLIKMYSWEYAFKRVVEKLRKNECIMILEGALTRTLNLAVNTVFVEVVMCATFVTYTLVGGELTVRKVFTFLALLNLCRQTVTVLFVRGLFYLNEATVAFRRIQDLLVLDEVDSSQHPYLCSGQKPKSNTLCLTEKAEETRLTLNKLGASWYSENNRMALSGISFHVAKNSLMAIVGPVGAGKSTLLQCLLGELDPMDGSVDVCGELSYATQDPWVFSGTLRDNILFQHPYQEEWYEHVLEACALKKDIAQLPDGDLTLVGERGVTLSGGQKARVNLARAVYHRADVYVLDDPLSAVDTGVAKHIFEQCIKGLLADKMVVLVTHQLQFLERVDKIFALKDGCTEAFGSLYELQASGFDPIKLVGESKGDAEDWSEYTLPVKDSTEFDNDAVTLKAAPSVMTLDEDNLISSPVDEEKAHGILTMKTYYKYFTAGAYIPVLVLLAAIFIMGESAVVLSTWWISNWASCSTFNSSLLTTNSSGGLCALGVEDRAAIYGGITAGAVLLNSLRVLSLLCLVLNASRVLHNKMFAAILRAPIRFFDTNPSGRVLNRFSKDIGFLDDLLPYHYIDFSVVIFKFLSAVILAAISNYWIIIPSFFLLLLIVLMREYYLRTSRDIKRLEAIARSPLYSHISNTLAGLSTIRVFKKQDIMLRYFHKYQNEQTQGWYLYLTSARWFGIRVDFLCAVFIGCVAFGAIPLASTLDAGLVGLGLTYIVSVAGLAQYAVRTSAEIENVMVSAERIMQYSALEPEAPLETIPPNEKPPDDWPQTGEIVMDDACFQYSYDTPMVLKSLCCSIAGCEKVGIVGRTGAGKSSIISMLFRLAEPMGLVYIDGVDTKQLGLHHLRGKMSIIPQDPVLFSGSVRYNLDPFNEYTDALMWKVLEQVQLKSVVEDLDGGLEAQVSEGGSNFSVGQRQLVCLARALLRRNKILVLDEATANVDMETDSIIQSTIRQEFNQCTVLTIAHRLNTVIDSDRIMVMDAGKIKEFGHAHILLQDPSSLLSRMVEKTGPTASRRLQQMAMDAYISQNSGRVVFYQAQNRVETTV